MKRYQSTMIGIASFVGISSFILWYSHYKNKDYSNIAINNAIYQLNTNPNLVYGTWIQKDDSYFIGGINVKEDNYISQHRFLAKDNGRIIKIN